MFLDISRLRRTETRSICPENFTGAKGAAAMATEGTGVIPRASILSWTLIGP